MRAILLLLLLIGLAIIVVAGSGYVRTVGHSATIISELGDLRPPSTLERSHQVESHTSRRLSEIRDGFIPIMWLGGAVSAMGLLGLIAKKKTPTGKGQQISGADADKLRSTE